MIKINKGFLDDMSRKSKESSRKRLIHNFHNDFGDPINRMVNALQPGTYTCPHKHEKPDKREVFILLTGCVVVIEFNEQGEISDHIILRKELGNFITEISPKTWHTVICLEENSAIYEVKDGPYIAKTDKIFASWAPKEGDAGSLDYMHRILNELELTPGL